MPSESSKKPAGKPVRRRKFSATQKRAAVTYAIQFGVVKAAAKFNVHPSAIYSWRQGGRGAGPAGQGKTAVVLDKVPAETYVLARKVQAALRATRSQGGDLTDLEIYSTLLVRKILGS